MRITAALLACLMLTAGCLGGGSDDEASQPQRIDANTGGDQVDETNATKNATYLQNTDYNQTHIHDYWDGAESKVIMDQVLETSTWIRWPGDGDVAAGGVWFSLPNGSFVPEGTGELVVQVDATGALKNGQIELSYKAANSDEYVATEPQGAQAEWLIELTPAMADLPHAKSTRWGFYMQADGIGGVLDGEVNVKITANKLFDLEAWPEHEDFWDAGERSKLHLAELEGTFDQLSTGFTFCISGVNDCEASGDVVPLPEGTIVPPETEVIVVKLWYERDSAPKNNVNGDVELAVKEGSSSSWYRNLDWSNKLEEKDGYKLYYVEVDGSNWDSPYAEQSAWGFSLQAPSGMHDVPEFGTFQMGIAHAGSGNYTLDVTAFRDMPGWLEGMIEED